MRKFFVTVAVSIALGLASYACGDSAKAAPSCADLQKQLNGCTTIKQSTKDSFGTFCGASSEACRSCLDGVLCGVTEQCDPQCKSAAVADAGDGG